MGPFCWSKTVQSGIHTVCMNTTLAPPTKEEVENALETAMTVVEKAEHSFRDTEDLIVEAILDAYSAGHAVGYSTGYEAGSHEGARSAFDLSELAVAQPIEPETVEEELCFCGCGLPASIWQIGEDEVELTAEEASEQLLLSLDIDLAELEEDVEDFKGEVELRLEAIELAIGLKYTGD